MKLLILILALFACSQAKHITKENTHVVDAIIRSLQTRAFEEELMAFLEKFRVTMLQGDPDLGIPVLDPLEVPVFEIHETIPQTATIDLVAKEIAIKGLSGFVVNAVSANIIKLRLDYNFTMPSIKLLAGYYKLDALVMEYPFWGEGTVDVEAINLNFAGYATITLKDGFLFMNHFEIKFALEQFKSNITGLLGGGEVNDVLNKIIEELVPALVESEGETISEFVSTTVTDFANGYLTHMTLKDLIDFITGAGGYKLKLN